ncbi:hypothetical protein AAGG74_18270 [Bacillus mexicanus]|uniref:flagellar biosynthesis protein FlhF n=1 Tax=Bacillus mexicanus TaxID=2834415 RepID=UPI003D1D6AAB
MSQIKKQIGYSPDEIYEIIEKEYGKNYKITNKKTKMKYHFPLTFKREYIFEYEITKEMKKDKKRLIEILNLSKENRELEMNSNQKVRLSKIESETEKVLSSDFSSVWDYLKEQEFNQKWIEYLLEKAQEENPETTEDWRKSINKIIESELNDWVEKNDFQIMTLFGPTGVGKTTTLIKIMNRLQTGNKKIGVITTDNFRVGAYEQMQNYSEKLKFPLIQSNVDELTIPVNVFKHKKGMDYILIDTYGRNSKDKEMKQELEMYLNTVNPESVCLVLAANQKYKDMVNTIKAYEGVNIDHLIITKMDETESYGFIYNLFKEFKIPISYQTFGQQVPDDIELFTAKKYTEKIWESFS